MAKYTPKDCPCPSDCKRRGHCRECIAFHHGRGEQTYCEFLTDGPPELSAASGHVYSGRELRLLDYGPCAG